MLLKTALVTSAIGLLAATYSIRAVHYFQNGGHSDLEGSCEWRDEEEEEQTDAAAPPDDEQVPCWTDLRSQSNWQIIDQ